MQTFPFFSRILAIAAVVPGLLTDLRAQETASISPAESRPKPRQTREERQKKKEEEKDKAAEIKADIDKLGFSRAPYVQLATATSIRVVWRTVRAIKPEVRIGLSMERLDRRITGQAILQRQVSEEKLKNKDAAKLDPKPLHSAPKKTSQFEAVIEGLSPDTRYFYAIYDGEKRLTPPEPTFYFRTAPTPGQDREAYFWVVGDSGTAERRQEQVYEAMLSYNAHLGRPLDFYLHVGDMAYSAGKDDQFTKGFFRTYEKTLRNTVVWPAIGNHEGTTAEGEYGVGPYFDAYISPTKGEAGGLPSGNESYYSWDYAKIHFIVLNSFDLSRAVSAPMAQWLQADLARTKADWIVAYWHHPPYTKGTHDSDKEKESVEMRENILPILESGGVDVVFTGHSHIYERSMLIDGAYSTPTKAENYVLDDGDGNPQGEGPYKKNPGINANEGAVHVVAGNSGAGVGRKGTLPLMKSVIVEHGSVLVSVKGNAFSAIMINYQGEVRDHWQIVKTPGVKPTRIANPRQLPPFVRPGADLPNHYAEVVQKGSEWRYLAGEDPAANWVANDFADSAWKKAKAGFGYGDDDDKTKLEDMHDRYNRVYVRSEFEVTKDDDLKKMGLAIRYDDAFVAYLNGKEFLRMGVGKGAGPSAEEIGDHEADADFEFFAFGKSAEFLKEGKNVIAIEGHTINSDEGDFTLDPMIIAPFERPERPEGGRSLFTHVLETNAAWRYTTAEEPGQNWFAPEFADKEWDIGSGGFAYGVDLKRLVGTDMKDAMKDKRRVLYIRTKFRVDSEKDLERMGLSLLWDDGFVAYLNGKEIARNGLQGTGSKASRMVHSKNANSGYFPFRQLAENLRLGENTIAIEGHNYSADSDDFVLIPSIIRPWTDMGEREGPKHYAYQIPKEDEWELLAGQDPEVDWTKNLASNAGWETGPVAIGYGLDGLETKLDKMRGKHRRVYLRHEFDLAKEEDKKELGLLMSWNDAFVAYLNGQEVIRVGVEQGSGAQAQGIYRAQGLTPMLTRYFPFKSKPPEERKEEATAAGRPPGGRGGRGGRGEPPKPVDFTPYLRVGKNILAIEGHNFALDSSDFILSPKLLLTTKPAKREQIPPSFTPIIAENAVWQYLAGTHPEDGWTTTGQASGPHWKTGKLPIGYEESAGTIERETRLSDMQDHFASVYLRNAFTLKSAEEMKGLGLAMRWDDGFIAYLNGQEILRENVPNGRGAEASGMASVNPAKWEVFPLADFQQHLREGENIIAIEGHNSDKDSSDFLLDSFLVRSESTAMPKEFTPLIPAGDTWAYWADRKAPPENWQASNFADTAWLQGKAPLGYDGEADPAKRYDNTTVINDMKEGFSTLYLRHRFTLTEAERTQPGLGLALRYDDGVIVHLNGKEAFRVNVASDGKVANHEAAKEPIFLSLDRFQEHLLAGENVLAIEVHNEKIDSSDLTIDPMLLRRK